MFSKRTKLSKVICFATVLCMLITMIPAQAFAKSDTSFTKNESDKVKNVQEKNVNGEIAINEVNFPDESFRQKMLEKDIDGSGYLSPEEIKLIERLDFEYEYLTNLKGIEYLTSLKILNCNDCDMTVEKLDLSKNTELTHLNCSSNIIRALDLSNNTKLVNLNCSRNNILELDISNNLKLVNLDCSRNNILELDTSKNINLTELDCSYNTDYDDKALSTLDLSNNVKIKKLYCIENDMSDLNLSNNTELTDLNCSYNNISSLNLLNNRKLVNLDCSYNAIVKLDISKNINLTELNCADNAISELDVDKNINLTKLDCSGNNISVLNLSNSSKFTYIDCSYNAISELDVSRNINLTELNCHSNNISALNLANSSKLVNLDCSYNAISELDVSKNTELLTLDCSYNVISELDVGKNVNLENLDCSNNKLNSIDIKNNQYISVLKAQCNNIKSVDTSNNSELVNIFYLSRITEMPESGVLDYTSIPGFEEALVDPYSESEEGVVVDRQEMTISLENGKEIGKLNIDGDIFYFLRCNSTVLDEITKGIVDINKTNFPDDSFRSVISDEDINIDEKLSLVEINRIKNLDSLYGVKDLKGIEYLTELEILDCSDSHLSNLDVSNNTKLKKLSCVDNKLNTLDVGNNTKLEMILCGNNNISSLDLSNNKELITLSCYNNKLSNLDVSNNTKLQNIYCDNNNISSLNLSKNRNLVELYCSFNDISKLDVSKNVNLEVLDCSNNKLNSIDIKNNKSLRSLLAQCNNIKNVDISNNDNIYLFYLASETEMPASGVLNYKEIPGFEGNLQYTYIVEEDGVIIDRNAGTIRLKDGVKEGTLKLDEDVFKFILGKSVADYSKVDAAIAKIPADLSIYTDETVKAVTDAKNAVVRNLDVTKQAEVDKMAKAIEDAVVGLKLKKADYSKVDAAITKIPTDLSIYTDETVAAVNKAKDAVVRNLDVTKQAEVDEMAKAIEDALIALEVKEGNVPVRNIGTVSLNSYFYKVNDVTFRGAYNGNQMKATPIVKNEKGEVLKVDVDYEVTYSNDERISVGAYTFTVKGIGDYTGETTCKLIMTPKAVANVKVRHGAYSGGYDDAYVTWNKSVGADGYYVYMRRPNIKDNAWVSLGTVKETSLLKKDLADGYKYEFKVLPYVQDNMKYRTTGKFKVADMQTLMKAKINTAKKYNNERTRLTWTNVKGVTGYQVMVSAKGNTRYFTINSPAANAKVIKNAKTSFKVRAYKDVKNNSGKTVRVYAPWSDDRIFTLR